MHIFSNQGQLAPSADAPTDMADSKAQGEAHSRYLAKVELMHGESFVIRQDMRRAVFEYIEIEYDRTRRRCANGYNSPLAFENKKAA